MPIDELVTRVKLADLERAATWWDGPSVLAPAQAWRALACRPLTSEPPRADARRVLGRWLARRRAAMRAACAG